MTFLLGTAISESVRVPIRFNCQDKDIIIKQRMTMKQRCLLNLYMELVNFFKLLVLSLRGIDTTELPAVSEHLPEGGIL